MAELKKISESDLIRINKIIDEYKSQKWALIPMLQKIQYEIGYIPTEVIDPIAKAAGKWEEKE